jgi:hypothetical protein
MSNTPRHCDIAIEYFALAKELGSYEEANKHFEYHANHTSWSGFHGVNAPSFSPHLHYRRKPETHMVNGHEVPAPYNVAPCSREEYFSIVGICIDRNKWVGNCVEVNYLISNNCFRSESDAEENRLAMFKLGKYAEVKL